ncbi:MAG: hypothetical protein RIB03_13700 [Henriciella sp.]|uniref:hypothetical protein n=1 Tax=Henriciella sp. TaxID=1968823 RepID=UPI0032EB2D46
MRQHAFAAISAAALLTACGPGEPEPVPTPPVDPEATSGASTSAGMSSDASMSGSQDAGDGASGEAYPDADPTYTGGVEIDIESAMSEPAAEGVWVTQPNWTGFGPENSEASFMVRCAEYGMIRMTRMVDIDPAKPAPAVITAGGETERGYWKAQENAELPAADLEIYAESPVFTAMMGADKIGVLAEGKPPLIVPGDPQLDQQIDSCRNKGSGTP